MAANEGAVASIKVKGLRELNRALNSYNKDVRKELRKELRVVATPVKTLATQLALGEITNMTAHWARMRLGVAAKSVYIVPYSRNAGGSRRTAAMGPPSFVDLMLDRAMNPALEQNEDNVMRGLERMLGVLADRHGF